MIDLGNFRIIQLDRYNLTYEEFRDVESKSTKEITKKWVRVGGYYGNLQNCVKALKDYVITQKLQDDSCNTPNDIIDYLDKLNNSYINCDLKIKEVD